MARKKYKDHMGERFGRLVVIGRATNDSSGNAMWNCICDCGHETTVLGRSLRRGATRSCGCFLSESSKKRMSKIMRKHGLSHTPLYRVWASMKERCNSEDCKGYKNYGARGIKVCSEWEEDFQVFYDWAIANGYAEGLEIDRIDNDGDYSPINCRFITPKANCRNQRRNVQVIVYDKITKSTQVCRSLSEAAEVTGLNPQRIRRNMDQGYLEKRYCFSTIKSKEKEQQ